MRVLQINTVYGAGSTGRIVAQLYNKLLSEGHDCLVCFGRGDATGETPGDINSYRIGSDSDMHIHALMTRITDKTGFYSKAATKSLITKIKEFDPDIIHLHNLHGYYLNLEILLKYLSETDTPVIWTLHDCWAFTGHCAYFDSINCNKWKTGCYKCGLKQSYPKSLLLDNSKWNYKHKKELFTSVKNMTIITPSKWLAKKVKESFLGKYDIKVINNGIDLDVFKPVKSAFREKYNLTDKFVILGVANIWERRKGLQDFVKLSAELNANDYKIVLVGLNKKQINSLPENILGLEKTGSARELAGIYSSVDIYVNLSIEETMGLTTVEALACGTPVIVYDATAIPECVNPNVGFVIVKNNIKVLAETIDFIRKKRPFAGEACLNKAASYNIKNINNKYFDVYKKSVQNGM